MHGRAEEQRAVDVLHRDVEVERCLVGEHIVVRNAERLGEHRDEVDDGSMANGHALRLAGRAAREVDVERIGRERLGAPDCQKRIVDGAGEQLVHMDERCSIGEEIPGLCGTLVVHHDECGLEAASDLLDARLRLAQVDERVAAAGLNGSEQRADGGDALVEVDGDGPAWLDVRRDGRADRPGSLLELRKAHGTLDVRERRLAGMLLCGGLKPFEHVVHGASLSAFAIRARWSACGTYHILSEHRPAWRTHAPRTPPSCQASRSARCPQSTSG